MKARTAWGWIMASGALLACGGCGFKGPLYLPERNATVVTHPPQAAQGQAAPSAGQAQTPAAKSKGKTPQPPGSAPATPPQSPPPP